MNESSIYGIVYTSIDKFLKMLTEFWNPKCLIISVSIMCLSMYFYNSYLDKKNRSLLGSLTQLSKCPACYGMSACTAFYSGQVRLSLTPNNSKNTYYGTHKKTNQRVALKKLASEQDLQIFDDTLCEVWGLESSCNPMDLHKRFKINDVKDMINKSVTWNFTFPSLKGRHLVFCPCLDGFYDFLKPVFTKNASDNTIKADLIHTWTMLNINVEPILLQVISSSRDWSIPTYGGCCGRLELVSDRGVPLSILSHLSFKKRCLIARSLVDAAIELTFMHKRFRFYMLDWSKDNILVTEQYLVTFASFDNVVVLDTKAPSKPVHDKFLMWHTKYHRRNDSPEYGTSHEHISNMCSYHLSDHNFWELCKLFTSDEEPLLRGHTANLTLVKLLERCKMDDEDKVVVIFDMHTSLNSILMEFQSLGSPSFN